VRKLPSRKLLATIVAGALFIPHTGFTLGLGEIEVNSALNQKLKADIELLSATPEDTENIIVKLASRKEFSRAGLDRPYSLNDLRFKSEVIDGVPHIKVSSGSPIREPYLNFLIEIDWPNGHLLREYTVLLDPPVFMTKANAVDKSESRPVSSGPAASVAAPIPAATSISRPAVAAQPVVSSSRVSDSKSTAPAFMPAPVVRQQAPQQTPINQPVGSYRIKSGDTAWSLADAMRPDRSITVPQMMFSILRANPEAFINENINGLKRGYILRRPDAAQIAAINKADAQAMMHEHRALWRQYLQSQAGGQPVSAMQADGAAASTGTDGSGSTAADNAHLAIVSAGSGTSTASSKDPSEMTAQELRAELALARERVETERVEKEALQSRINTLEQHAEQREGLLTVEDEELSGVQSLNAPVEEAAADGEMVDEVAAEAESVDAATLESEGAAGEDVTAEDIAGEDIADEEQQQPADAVFADEVTGQDADESQAEDVASTDVATDQPAAIPSESEKPEQTDQLTQLLNDPKMMAAAGGGLLLIIAIIGLMLKLSKRRKTALDDAESTASGGFSDLESVADDIAEEAADEATVDSLAGDQVLDSEETSISESDSTEDTAIAEPAEAEVSEARDDVIAEADVYLAYGIYQQAEDLLNQAILENPDRNDYRVKLAETFYASKNATAFSEVAGEIKNRIDNEDSSEWQKVLTMGQELCADDPMFKAAELTDLDLGETVPDEPSMDFDLDTDEEDTEKVSDLNMDNELELPEADTVAEDDFEEEISAESAEEIKFDLSDTGAVEETETTEDKFSLDIDAAELDIDIQDVAESTTDTEEESIDLSDMDIAMGDAETTVEDAADEVHDLEDIEKDFALDESSDEELDTEKEITLDLTDEVEIESLDVESLDAESLDTETQEAEQLETESADIAVVEDEVKADAATAANDASVDEEDFDLSSLDDVDEISTKLDLARAYLDMGDQEGTRDILEEVLSDGSDEQKQEANELLEKLG